MSYVSLQQRVEIGAELLDEKVEGWAKTVNLDTLCMQSTCHCVLHDVYAAKLNIRDARERHDEISPPIYNRAVFGLGLSDSDEYGSSNAGNRDFENGFDCELNDPDYCDWEDYWKDEIMARL